MQTGRPSRNGPRHLGVALLAALVTACATQHLDLRPPEPATLAGVRNLAPHPCNPTTAAALDALRVPASDVESIYYHARVTGSENGHLQSYDAWIERRGGAAGLVVRHTPSCRFMTSYMR